VIEEDTGVAGPAEFPSGDRGDDDAADDEEEIDAEGSVLDEEQVIGGGVLCLDAMEMGQHDEQGRYAATDLNADDSPGLRFRHLLQGAVPVALLYQRKDARVDLEWGIAG